VFERFRARPGSSGRGPHSEPEGFFIKKYAETNKDLERNNAIKDRIFSMIALDLKSPFNALKGYRDMTGCSA